MPRFQGGWFRVDRRVFFDDLSQQGMAYVCIWLKLLAMANIAESNIAFKGKRIVLQPGQLVTSLAEICGKDIPKSTARRILVYLENSARIRRERGARGFLITI